MTQSLPPHNPRRQADSVARAFYYQFLETSIAWFELGAGDCLLIEVIEDFDLQTESELILTQVAHTSSGQRLTLRSEKARDALANYWSSSQKGTDAHISLVIHTNMQTTKEAGLAFPGQVPGIEYWSKVQAGADAEPLRLALLKVLEPSPLTQWLESCPSEEDLRSKLFDRIIWRTGQNAGPERKALLSKLIEGRLSSLGLPVGLASIATGLIQNKIFDTAGENEEGLRRLSASDLNTFLNQIARPGQPGHETVWSLATWTIPLDAVPLPRFCAERQSVVSDFVGKLKTTFALWLYGASGTAKTTLALQIAKKLGNKWLLIEFRDQIEPSEVLLRLNRAYTDITLTEGANGIILDDVNTDIVRKYASHFSIFSEWLKQKGYHIVFTSAYTPSPALASALGLQLESIVEAPYFTQDEIREMVSLAKAPEHSVDAWTFLIFASTTIGHPQLVAAKIASLAVRSWPADALTEDLSGSTSEAISLTRAEARRRLIADATDEGRALLKRLSCIFLKFDRAAAIAAASVDPAIKDASASLDLLTGPWIERVPGSDHFFRLSPVLSGINDDLDLEMRKSVQASIVILIVKQHTIPFDALDMVFWNALFGEQGWFFVNFFQYLLSVSEEHGAAMASRLGAIVYLTTERPLLQDDPIGSMLVRLIQIDIAVINGEQELFQPIAEAALREANEQEPRELRDSMQLMALMKVLIARGTKLDWQLRLRWIADYEGLAERDPLLLERINLPAHEELKSEYGELADISGLFLTIGIQSIDTPELLEKLFNALGKLETGMRHDRLAQLSAFSNEYDLIVQSAWARASANSLLNPEKAIESYQRMELMARNWSDKMLADQCLVAQSVLWDEFQSDHSKALEILNAELSLDESNTLLLRQKAKVLGHMGQFAQARGILEAIRPSLSSRSELERMYQLKDEAVAAAKLGDFKNGRKLFLEAAAAAKKASEDLPSMHYHGLALRNEATLCAWHQGEFEKAIRELAQTLEKVVKINPHESDAALMLHAKTRWLVGWLERITDVPRGTPPPELVTGAMSSLDTEIKDEDRVDRGSFEDVKLLLILSGLRCGVTDLFPEIKWELTTPGFHFFLKSAEFDLAVETQDPSVIANATLNVAAAFGIMAATKIGNLVDPLNLPIQNGGGITESDLASPTIRLATEQLIAIATFRVCKLGGKVQPLLSEVIDCCEYQLGDGGGSLQRLRDIAIGSSIPDESNYAEQLIAHMVSKKDEPVHPRDLLSHHIVLVACAGMGGAGIQSIHHIFDIIAEDWNIVLERQRFLLSQPANVVPQIEALIVNLSEWKPGALTQLLQTAADALRIPINDAWHPIINQVGGAVDGSIPMS